MKKLYISDLDGTLLDDNAALSSVSHQLLSELLEQGIFFTVASARSVQSIQPILKNLPLKLPIIGQNGSALSALDSGKHLEIDSIPSPLVHQLYAEIRRHGLFPFISANQGQTDSLYYQDIPNKGMMFFFDDRVDAGDARLKRTEDFELVLDENIISITIIDTFDRLNPLKTNLNANFGNAIQTFFYENPYSPGWYWLTLHSATGTKAHGIQRLIERYALENYEVVVFGDNVNDMEMIQSADRGIAMGNAKPLVKQIATEVIGTNEEDSVVHFIAKDVEYGQEEIPLPISA